MALWPHVVTRWKHCKDTQTRSLREGQLLWRLIRKRWSTSHAQTDGVQQKKKSKKCLFFSLSLYLVLQLCFSHPAVSFIRRPPNWFLISCSIFVIIEMTILLRSRNIRHLTTKTLISRLTDMITKPSLEMILLL